MEFGFVTWYSEGLLEKAQRLGFDCVEIFTDKDSPLDVDKLTEDDYKRLADERAKYSINFSAVASAVNHLIADDNAREVNQEYFKKVIKAAGKFDSKLVMTNVWADSALSPSDNLKRFKAVFSEYAKIAEDNGVRIVVENCPHLGSYPMTIGNICYSPQMWEAMFDLVPSPALGIEYDPSHMYWQRIDYLKAITDFGSRIYCCHAKDTEINYEVMGRTGIFGEQINRKNDWETGWWRYRIPGFGEIDWKNVFCRLYDIGFDGPVFIEHEDPVFEGAKFEEGLSMGLRFLKQFTPPKD